MLSSLPKDTMSQVKLHSKIIKCHKGVIQLSEPVVMGIINATPDSFYDGGKSEVVSSALELAEKHLLDGAVILDIGGQSSRPKATRISEKEEWLRVSEIISEIHNQFPKAIISIDTFYGSVAEKAIMAGASIVNDISAGSIDPSIIDVTSELKVPYVLMHMLKTPSTMQDDPKYIDVVKEVKTFFTEKIDQLSSKGIDQIILDPGFGFGKTVTHNYQLLKHFDRFSSFDLPLLCGISRKSMLNKLLDIDADQALNATTAGHIYALEGGANILRVHDTKEASEAVKMFSFMQSID